jgi:hypothetical protein
MADYESGEIRRHAVIGGLIAVFLAAFHMLEQNTLESLAEPNAGPKIWLRVLLLFVAFILAFIAIWIIETVWHRVQWNKQISIPNFGIVDGRWIDAIVQDGRVAQGSVLTIKSAAGEGFSVDGLSYSVNLEKDVDPAPCGTFSGRRGDHFASDGISFGYKGIQEGVEHFGIVYYQFLFCGCLPRP